MKKFLAGLLLLFIFMIAAAAPSYAENGYKIKDYLVEVNVRENNIYEVTETITADFLSNDKHGIRRGLPVVSEAIREINGRSVKKKHAIIISDVSVLDVTNSSAPKNVLADMSRDGNELMLTIGEEDVYVKGTRVYLIKYKYDIGDDGIRQVDDFYYNLNGSFDTTIDSLRFVIHMPKEFNASSLSITKGTYGSTDSKGIEYNVSDNTIRGRTLVALKPYSFVTARLELPEGYFIGARDNAIKVNILAIILYVLSIALALLLWAKFGKDDILVPVVSFHAPNDMTPSQVGYYIDSIVDNKDLISLIMYWADKGYIEIRVDDGKRKDFTLIKRSPAAADMMGHEKIMYDALFKKSDEVKAEDLKYSFYEKFNSAKMALENECRTKGRIYTKSGSVASVCCMLISSLCIFSMLYYVIYNYTFDYTFGLFVGAIAAAVNIFFCLVLLRRVKKSTVEGGIKWKAMSFLYAILCTAICLILILAVPALATQSIIAAVGVIVAGICSAVCEKRTKESNELLGKLLGFREFIKHAEKDKIEALVEEDPQYFYHVLPYAYAMNITDKWAKGFESIAVEPPHYMNYQGRDIFTTMIFYNMLNRNMNIYMSNMLAVQSTKGSSTGGGGFGGGGFSGGGFGGGSGSSW